VPSSESLRDARTMVRRFARATNLVLAGRTVAVVLGHDDTPDVYERYSAADLEAALYAVLQACGARPAPHAELAFACAGGSVTALAELHPMVIADVHGRLVDHHGERLAPPLLRANIPFFDGVAVADSRIGLPPRPPLPNAESRIRWARALLRICTSFVEELTWSGLLVGHRIGISMVLEPKTAALAIMLRGAGAEVSVFAHHYETDDEVAAVLSGAGVPVFADAGGDAETDHDLAVAFLDRRPDVLIDDGAHVIRLALREREEIVAGLIGAAEETTSGLRALRELGDDLVLPVIAVNDALVKTRFDNRYGTGQSCVFAIADLIEEAGLLRQRGSRLDDAIVVVLGFGPVGQGVAQYARALGAMVFVADIDPRAELEARFAGYHTGPADLLVRGADLVISATGMPGTVTAELARAADGAVLAVAGGVDQEIELNRIRGLATATRLADKVEKFDFATGERIAVLDDGGCINITSAEGNPIEIMDLSFAAQLEALRILLDSADAEPLAPGVHGLPATADRRIAERALRGHEAEE
jgi:adenosylhomocysteinase